MGDKAMGQGNAMHHFMQWCITARDSYRLIVIQNFVKFIKFTFKLNNNNNSIVTTTKFRHCQHIMQQAPIHHGYTFFLTNS